MNAKTVSISHRLAMTMAVVAIILIAAAGAGASEPQPQGTVTTAFTYQGRLANDGGDPIDDNCDLQFTLWDDPLAGSQVGPLLNPTGVAVTDGLFTVQLDFGEVFDGTALWLKVAVKCTGDPGYTTLAPRQALTPAPYAAYALNAQTSDMLDGYHGDYYLNATHISSGTLGTGYYSAYDDLGIEGYLGDGEGDLARNNSVLQPTLNADMVDGYHASDLAPAGHNHWGQSWSGSGTGLTLSGGGTGLSGSGSNCGVYGQTDSPNGYGVYAYNSASAGGYSYGMVAQTDSPYGTGVFAYANSYASGGSATGVEGISNSPNGYGGWFEANTNGNATTTQAGLYGGNDSDIGFGVVGFNSANGTGVGAWSNTGRIFQGYSGWYPAVSILRFYVTTGGAVWADDGFYTFKETDGGEHRTLYSMTSAEAWTEDFGRATLNNGVATVSIDPTFARTVNLTLEYHIYLTPICPDLIVLAVTGQRPDSFTVQGATLDGKPSGCAFDYRIVAKQRGHEDERLEKVDIPEPVEVDREESQAPGAAGSEPEGGR